MTIPSQFDSPSPETSHITGDTTDRWRRIIQLMAAITRVDAVLLLRMLPGEASIEVLATNGQPDNPISEDARIPLRADTYCYHVITTRQPMYVPDAMTDGRWSTPPLGMRTYAGVPLLWPDGSVFGSMCLLNREPRSFAPEVIAMLDQFRAAIESDLHSLVMEQQTRQMRQELREAQSLAKMGSWQWDAGRDHFTASAGVYALFGLPLPDSPVESLAEGVGYLRTVVHPDDWIDLQTVADHLRFFADGSVRTYRVRHPDTGERWLRSVSMHVHDEDGSLLRVRGTVQDVTDSVQAEIRQREAAIEHERTELLVRFVRDLAHEIKTPLSVIETSLHVLHRAADAERREKHLGKIHLQILHVSDMVDALTQIAQLDTLKVSEQVPVDLAVVLREAVSVARLRRCDVAYNVRLNLPETCALPAAHERELSLAFVNLLDNAFRFTPEDGSVQVEMEVEGSAATIMIRDSGAGMTGDVLQRCFERFYRGDPSRTTRGLGMGLPIAQKVIELHGGDIFAESVPGEGSTFTVVLPMGNRL